ncbi:MAG: hypothetical protein KZQ91_12965 [Candidatus Thiodiazotropha sp. (ex Lucinoma borealis)]|nr:hypothetical protein [Candidatus Thiodiazotropha sp. (ex Lucinoma borealis)]
MNLCTANINSLYSWSARRFIHAIMIISIMIMQTAYSAETAEFERLDEIELKSLDEHLQAMKALAPQLRIQLRSMRMAANFEIREIHNIERSIGKAQTDLERLIAMHKRNGINKVRAHFIADDLRRKASSLDQGLVHVTKQLEKKYGISIVYDSQRQKLSEQDNQLLSLLEDYNQLVKQSLQVISGEIR